MVCGELGASPEQDAAAAALAPRKRATQVPVLRRMVPSRAKAKCIENTGRPRQRKRDARAQLAAVGWQRDSVRNPRDRRRTGRPLRPLSSRRRAGSCSACEFRPAHSSTCGNQRPDGGARLREPGLFCPRTAHLRRAGGVQRSRGHGRGLAIVRDRRRRAWSTRSPTIPRPRPKLRPTVDTPSRGSRWLLLVWARRSRGA